MTLVNDVVDQPSRDTTSFQRRYDVVSTLKRRCVSTGKKLTNRGKRKVMRTLKLMRKTDAGNFMFKQIQYLSGINKVTTRTERSVLNMNG